MSLDETPGLDIAHLVQPNDTVVVAQGPSMPQTLCEMMIAAAGRIGPVRLVTGGLFSPIFDPAAAPDFRYLGYGAIGSGATALAGAGRLDILPTSYGQVGALFSGRHLAADVVLLQLSPPRNGVSTLGLTNDYALDAARHARTVIAEVNDQMPWIPGAECPPDLRIDAKIEVSRPPVAVAPARVGDVETRIAALVAGLVPDGATLQTGIGAIPDAILTAMSGHRRLGVHSGMIGDRMVDLIREGVVTNEAKPIDTGLTVTNVVLGSESAYRFVDGNDAVRLYHTGYTHAVATIAAIPDFIAINSAIEVDLTGQVNAEVANGRYLGAIGGQPDFVRGALLSEGGRSLIVLPSTARKGTVSRIVADLSGGIVTTPRSDADVVVTEWGCAELRGRSLPERARRIAAIAAPEHREHLERVARERFGGE